MHSSPSLLIKLPTSVSRLCARIFLIGEDIERPSRFGEKILARIIRSLAQFDEILPGEFAGHPAAPLLGLSRDEYSVHITHPCLHNGSDRVVHRELADIGGAKQNDVGLFAGCQRAALGVQSAAFGATNGRE